MNTADLVGVWELEKCEGRSTDGRTFYPYGTSPSGKLIYLSNGHMAVTLMASGRNRFQSEDISQATSNELKLAFESFDAYSGRWRFEIHEKENLVIHQIEQGRIPNWVGQSHQRFCALRGENLTLTTLPFEMAGVRWSVEVIWKRIRE